MAIPFHYLKTVELSRVAPPRGTTPNTASLPFTYFDILSMTALPVEQLFLYQYPHSTDYFLSSVVPSLKSSLALALKTYYPLAGGYRRTPGTDDQFEHYYVEGDAVSFTVAKSCSDGQFEDLTSDRECGVTQLCPLAPPLPKSELLQPLFAVQATIFPGRGIVIGTSVHRAACDGTSFMQFMHTWAEICSTGASKSSRVPTFDRTLISDPTNVYSYFYKKMQEALKSVPNDDMIMMLKNLSEPILASFTLKQEQIQRLKQLISAKADQERKSSSRCSTIVITLSYVWTCFVRAKHVDSNTSVCVAMPTDFRTRIQPPLPIEYFGNCVGLCLVKANVVDLIQEDGFIVAAEAMRKAIDQLTGSSEKQEDIFEECRLFWGTPPSRVQAGSPKLKVYDIDFGLGKPKKVIDLSAARTMDGMSVADSRDEQGGVEIGIALQRDEMDCFKKYFFEGLRLL